MSRRPISRSPDLKRLRDEGFDLDIVNGYLLVRDVPYVNQERKVKRGILISALALAGDVTTKPSTHVAMFAGEHPCHADGSIISKIANPSPPISIEPGGLVADFHFSAKPLPDGAYPDFYEKITTYVDIISGPVQLFDRDATAKTFPAIKEHDEQPVFKYIDTATSRANIAEITAKLVGLKIAIVGIGGTGAYILDLVSKTPVSEIHLFDADVFSQHNAFRVPGAASLEDLERRPTKVAYLADLYSRMRYGIVPHEQMVTSENIGDLGGMSFVFLSLDKGKVKQIIVDRLITDGIPFVDVGMGVMAVEGRLIGQVRTTTGSKQKHDHVSKLIPMSDAGGGNEYDSNIQIAELNALNAALAVIKWKKLFGFYADLEDEHDSVYQIDGNTLVNSERKK